VIGLKSAELGLGVPGAAASHWLRYSRRPRHLVLAALEPVPCRAMVRTRVE
jgi:hypothetical protein